MQRLLELGRLALLAIDTNLSDEVCRERLAILERLLKRHADGTLKLKSLVETRVEQSFNEQLFAELFLYKTLFRDGQGAYHLQPKQHYPATRSFDDFSLGFFGPAGGTPIVLAELKSPGTDLDKPQPGYPDNPTPVAQALAAATGTTVQWVLVSNFDEIRLYRPPHPDRFEIVRLTEILTASDFRRAYALLGRPFLLGTGTGSPLLRVVDGDPPMTIPQLDPRLRLVHQARVHVDAGATNADRRLPQLEDALNTGLTRVPAWPNVRRGESPEIAGESELGADRLVLQHAIGDDLTRIELARDATLRVSEYATDNSGILDAGRLAIRMAFFTIFSTRVLAPLGGNRLELSWMMLDTKPGVVLSVPAGWANGTDYRFEGTGPMVKTATAVLLARAGLAERLSAVHLSLGELIYPFATSTGGARTRARPTVEQMKDVMAEGLVRMLAEQ